MKKLFVILLSVLMFTSVFAAQSNKTIYSEAFEPQVCLRTSGLEYTLFRNQASLADNFGFSLEIPSFSTSVYNVAGIMASEKGSTALAALFGNNESTQEFSDILLDLGLSLVEQLQGKAKKNSIASADLGMGFSVNSFAMGVNSKLSINTFNPGSTLSMSACAVGDLSISLAYGRSVLNDGVTKVSVGAALRPSYRIYTLLDADKIAEYAQKLSSINDLNLTTLKYSEGLGIPIDFSVAFSRYNGKLELIAQAENVLGFYFINDSCYEELGKNILPLKPSRILYTPMKLNLSLVYNPERRFLNPSFAAEFVDINGYINNIITTSFMAKNILMYLNADVNLNVLQVLDVTAGIHGGYLYGGAALSIGGNRFEMLYNWSEFGDELGESAVDTLTLRVRLGYGL